MHSSFGGLCFLWLLVLQAAAFIPVGTLVVLKRNCYWSNNLTFTLMFMHVVGFTLLKANLTLSTHELQPETFGEAAGFVLRAAWHS